MIFSRGAISHWGVDAIRQVHQVYLANEDLKAINQNLNSTNLVTAYSGDKASIVELKDWKSDAISHSH